MKFRKGDRVFHQATPELLGTVIGVTNGLDQGWVRVEWDSGYSGANPTGMLELYRPPIGTRVRDDTPAPSAVEGTIISHVGKRKVEIEWDKSSWVGKETLRYPFKAKHSVIELESEVQEKFGGGATAGTPIYDEMNPDQEIPPHHVDQFQHYIHATSFDPKPNLDKAIGYIKDRWGEPDDLEDLALRVEEKIAELSKEKALDLYPWQEKFLSDIFGPDFGLNARGYVPGGIPLEAAEIPTGKIFIDGIEMGGVDGVIVASPRQYGKSSIVDKELKDIRLDTLPREESFEFTISDPSPELLKIFNLPTTLGETKKLDKRDFRSVAQIEYDRGRSETKDRDLEKMANQRKEIRNLQALIERERGQHQADLREERDYQAALEKRIANYEYAIRESNIASGRLKDPNSRWTQFLRRAGVYR